MRWTDKHTTNWVMGPLAVTRIHSRGQWVITLHRSRTNGFFRPPYFKLVIGYGPNKSRGERFIRLATL